MSNLPKTNAVDKPKHQRMGVSEAMDLAAKARQSNLSGKTPLPAFKPFSVDENDLHTTQSNVVNDRDIRTVLLELIDENPYAPREIYSPDVLRERAESLRANGQYEVIHIIPHPETTGRFMIADGWTRVTACRTHEVSDSLAAQIHHDMTPMQAAWLGYNQNESRAQHCDLDRAFFFDKMYSQGLTQSEIAKRTGISQTQLSFYTAFRKLPEETLQIIRMHPHRFPAYIAQNLAKVARKVSEDKASSLALVFTTNGQSVNWLINHCTVLLDQEKSTPLKKKVGKVFRYSNGVLRQKGVKFDLSLEIEEDEQAEFTQALDELLSRFAKQSAPEVTNSKQQRS